LAVTRRKEWLDGLKKRFENHGMGKDENVALLLEKLKSLG